MYMLCYCVGKMNTPDNYKNIIYERKKELYKQLMNNSLYNRIKKLAKKAANPKIGKAEVTKKKWYDNDIDKLAKRFVYDNWDLRIEIGDHNSDFVHPNKCLSMLKYVEETETTGFGTDTYPVERGWLLNDALFCQPTFWSYFLNNSEKTRKVDLGAGPFGSVPIETKKLVDIMIALNHIYLDLGVGKLRNPDYGILSSKNEVFNYSVKETKWVKDCQKLKM